MEEKIKILLIEDNDADARLVDIHLKQSFGDGYQLETHSYLSKALKVLGKSIVDIIIVDLSLPDTVGMEAFTKVFEKSPKCPIIILTGLDDESMGVEAVRLGAQDFLIKGKASANSLKRSINYSLQRYKLLKELEEKTLALLKKQQQLALAQKISHIGSWELDLSDFSLKWSDELYKIYGVDPKIFTPTFEKFIEFGTQFVQVSKTMLNDLIWFRLVGFVPSDGELIHA